MFEKLGAADPMGCVRELLQQSELSAYESDDGGELLLTVPLVVSIYSSHSDRAERRRRNFSRVLQEQVANASCRVL